MKKSNSKLAGIIFIIIGIWFVTKVFGFAFPISGLFIKGWWTLFLIIPGLIELFQGKNRKAGVKKLILGIVLFLFCQRVLPFKTLILLVGAVLLLYYGWGLLFREKQGKGQGKGITFLYNTPDDDRYFGEAYKQAQSDAAKEKRMTSNVKSRKGAGVLVYSSLFSGKQINVENERFDGAELSCTLGSIQLDIRNSFVIDDVEIQASCVLGDIEIYLPEDIRVVVEGDAVLGSIAEKHRTPAWVDENTPIVTIKASCVLGSIEVK